MPHRQVVLTIPKRLRAYCLYRLRLPGEIARVPVLPVMSTGATNGLYLRNAGTPVYGVSGTFLLETFSHGMHERIPVKAFRESLEFRYRLVKSLAGPPKPVS